MKPTKEEVKKYFKDALEVECVYDREKQELKEDFEIEVNSTYGILYTYDKKGRIVYLYNHKNEVGTYAKITKRRESDTLTVPKQFVLDAYEAACSNWKEKLRLQFPDLFPTFFVKIGDRFECYGNEYILARLEPNVINLIRLNNGNNWKKPFKVQDCDNITKEEFKKLCDGFKLNKIS